MKRRFLFGNRKSWWNRQFTGKWLYGSYIGFAISVLIASQVTRWLVFALLILGCLFALAFRYWRNSI